MPHMKPNTTAKWPKRDLFSSWTWNKAVVGKACSGAYSGPPSRSLSRCFPALRGSDGSYEEEWTRGRGLGSRIPPFMNRGMRRKFYHWNLNQKFSPKLQMFTVDYQYYWQGTFTSWLSYNVLLQFEGKNSSWFSSLLQTRERLITCLHKIPVK